MSGEGSAETKPKVEAGVDDGSISITVKDQAGGAVVFKVKRTTKFSKIVDAFCHKKGWDPTQVRFVFDGNRLDRDSTPAEAEMEDKDVSWSMHPGLACGATHQGWSHCKLQAHCGWCNAGD